MIGQALNRIYAPEDHAQGIPEREIGTAISRGRADDTRWHLRADGQWFWANGMMMPMLEAGNLVGVVKIMRCHGPDEAARKRNRVEPFPDRTEEKQCQVSHTQPDLPVLYTTGYTRNAIVHNGMLDSGVALLPKPFTLRELALKVRAVLDAAAGAGAGSQ
jgi:CheY-like chemotaxis protein